jgi:hypothetical protein
MEAFNEAAYHELMAYTLALGDPSFIHQHVVDAYAVQTALPDSKPIGIVFGLVGLYLHLELGFSGRQVQKAHMKLARVRRDWALPHLPQHRGNIVVSNVIATSPGEQRDSMISEWCRSVWKPWEPERNFIAALVRAEGCHGT